jgi:hypothetical protein
VNRRKTHTGPPEIALGEPDFLSGSAGHGSEGFWVTGLTGLRRKSTGSRRKIGSSKSGFTGCGSRITGTRVARILGSLSPGSSLVLGLTGDRALSPADVVWFCRRRPTRWVPLGCSLDEPKRRGKREGEPGVLRGTEACVAGEEEEKRRKKEEGEGSVREGGRERKRKKSK